MGYCVSCGKIDRDKLIPDGWFAVINPKDALQYCTNMHRQNQTRAMCICPECLVKHGSIDDAAGNRREYNSKSKPIEKEEDDGKTRFDYIAEFNGLTPVSESGKEPVVKIKKKRGRPKKVKP